MNSQPADINLDPAYDALAKRFSIESGALDQAFSCVSRISNPTVRAEALHDVSGWSRETATTAEEMTSIIDASKLTDAEKFTAKAITARWLFK